MLFNKLKDLVSNKKGSSEEDLDYLKGSIDLTPSSFSQDNVNNITKRGTNNIELNNFHDNDEDLNLIKKATLDEHVVSDKHYAPLDYGNINPGIMGGLDKNHALNMNEGLFNNSNIQSGSLNAELTPHLTNNKPNTYLTNELANEIGFNEPKKAYSNNFDDNSNNKEILLKLEILENKIEKLESKIELIYNLLAYKR